MKLVNTQQANNKRDFLVKIDFQVIYLFIGNYTAWTVARLSAVVDDGWADGFVAYSAPESAAVAAVF